MDKIGIISLAGTGPSNVPEPSGGDAVGGRGGERGGERGMERGGNRERVGGSTTPATVPQGGSGPGQGMGIIASLRATQQQQMGGGGGPPGMGGSMGMGGGGMDDRIVGGFGRAAVGLRADQVELNPSKTYEKLLLDNNIAHNQKLTLAHALLEVGDWESASKLLARLSALGVQPATWQPLGTTLCTILATELEPIFTSLAPKGIQARGLLDTAAALLSQPAVAAGGSTALVAAMPPTHKPGPPLSQRATSALLELGMFLCRDTRLLTKVVRAMRHHLLFYGLAPAPGEEEAPAQPQVITGGQLPPCMRQGLGGGHQLRERVLCCKAAGCTKVTRTASSRAHGLLCRLQPCVLRRPAWRRWSPACCCLRVRWCPLFLPWRMSCGTY